MPGENQKLQLHRGCLSTLSVGGAQKQNNPKMTQKCKDLKTPLHLHVDRKMRHVENGPAR